MQHEWYLLKRIVPSMAASTVAALEEDEEGYPLKLRLALLSVRIEDAIKSSCPKQQSAEERERRDRLAEPESEDSPQFVYYRKIYCWPESERDVAPSASLTSDDLLTMARPMRECDEWCFATIEAADPQDGLVMQHRYSVAPRSEAATSADCCQQELVVRSLLVPWTKGYFQAGDKYVLPFFPPGAHAALRPPPPASAQAGGAGSDIQHQLFTDVKLDGRSLDATALASLPKRLRRAVAAARRHQLIHSLRAVVAETWEAGFNALRVEVASLLPAAAVAALHAVADKLLVRGRGTAADATHALVRSRLTRAEALEAEGMFLQAAALYKANAEAAEAQPGVSLIAPDWAPGSAGCAMKLGQAWGYAGLAYKRAFVSAYGKQLAQSAIHAGGLPRAQWSRGLRETFAASFEAYNRGIAALAPPGAGGWPADGAPSPALERKLESERLDLLKKQCNLIASADERHTQQATETFLSVFRPYTAEKNLYCHSSAEYFFVVEIRKGGNVFALTSVADPTDTAIGDRIVVRRSFGEASPLARCSPDISAHH